MALAYIEAIQKLLHEVAEREEASVIQLGKKIAASIKKGGVLHAFGSGHSHILCEEMFHRSGSLVPVNAILDANFTQLGTVNPSLLERMPGYAELLVGSNDLREGEVLIIFSNSGINPVTVDMTLRAKELGLYVAAFTSAASYKEVASRHPDGLRLADVVDLVIDTGVPKGDGVLELDSRLPKVGPGSTVLTAALLNAVVVEVVKEMLDEEELPPIFVSGNVGGDEHNEKLMARYASRIPAFYKNLTEVSRTKTPNGKQG